MKKLDLSADEHILLLEALKLKEASLRRAVNASTNSKVIDALKEELQVCSTLQLKAA